MLNLSYLVVSNLSIHTITALINKDMTTRVNNSYLHHLPLNFLNKSKTSADYSSYTALYDEVLAFEVYSIEKPTFSFEFENTFYKVLQNDLSQSRPELSTDKLLTLDATNYVRLRDSDSATKSTSVSVNLKFLPQRTLQINDKNLSPYFYLNKLSFKDLNALSSQPELFNINSSLKAQSNLINLLR
jgi:hypothetical protein